MPTFNSDVLPDVTGRSLGRDDQRWDGKFRNIDISGIATGAIGSGSGSRLTPVTVPFAASMVFDMGFVSTAFTLTLTGNVTDSTIINLGSGHLVTFKIVQDATGDRTFVWPLNVKGGMDIGTAPNEVSTQLFYCDGVNLFAMTPGVIV